MNARATSAVSTAAILLAASLLSTLYGVREASTSDHQDTLQLVARPGADITDMYVFPAKNPDNVVFALNVHPLIPRGLAGGVGFDPGVMYQIQIDTVGDYRAHRVLQFKADGSGAAQRIRLYGPAPPGMAGTRSIFVSALGSTGFDATAHLPGGVTFFAGPRKDPFFFDLTQFFALVPDRNYKNHPDVPPPSASCFRSPTAAVDFFKDFNVLSFIVELPRALLETPANGGRINVWSTASISLSRGTETYEQIERWGRPGVKETLERFADHDLTNRSEPWADPTLKANIYRFMVTPKPAGAGRSRATARALAAVLVPDEMQVDLTAKGPATYLGVETKGLSGLPVGIVRVVPDAGLKGFKRSLRNGARQFGGRDPDSPIVDLSLGAIYGTILSKVGLAPDDRRGTDCLTSDGLKPPHKTLNGFPYLGAPV